MNRECRRLPCSHITQETRSREKVLYLSEMWEVVGIFYPLLSEPLRCQSQVNISDLSVDLHCRIFIFGITFARIFKS